MSNTTKNDARAAQREYLRKWRSENPDKVKAAQMRYWAKKAAEIREAADNQDDKNEIC